MTDEQIIKIAQAAGLEDEPSPKIVEFLRNFAKYVEAVNLMKDIQ